jgi:hypothetical protein
MITATHNSSYRVRGLGQVGRPNSHEPISETKSLENSPESISAGRRTWFYDFQ